jgi:hypothetical protein
MATGTIKNQHTGTWTSINANLKYQVRSGIVFVYVQGGAAHGSWTSIGTLPSNVAPTYNTYMMAYSSGNQYANLYIGSNGDVQHLGTSGAGATFAYPLP